MRNNQALRHLENNSLFAEEIGTPLRSKDRDPDANCIRLVTLVSRVSRSDFNVASSRTTARGILALGTVVTAPQVRALLE